MKETAVFSFGRMNPPTIGHLKLLKAISSIAAEHNAKGFMYLSMSHDPKKNPLSFEEKEYYIDEALRFNHIENVSVEGGKTMLNALHQVYEDDYKNVIVVIGSDRIDDGTAENLNKYNGRHAKNSALDELNFYDFDSIEFVSAGQRDEDSDDVATKASGTLVRKLVAENNYEEFAKYAIPLGEETTQDLFIEIKSGLNQ